jgi:signal peptidase I
MVIGESGIFLDTSSELLARGYALRFRAGGQSMHPTICDGEVIIVEPVCARQIKRGDIILYRAGRGVTAHRVIEIVRKKRSDPLFGSDPLFVLRGDAAATRDAPVGPENILGRVVSVERRGRRLSVTGRRARLKRLIRLYAAKLKGRLYSYRRIEL